MAITTGNGCPDGIHYDVKGNLWAAMARLGGILQIDLRGIMLGFVASTQRRSVDDQCCLQRPGQPLHVPGRHDQRDRLALEGALPGLIGPDGVRLPAQP